MALKCLAKEDTDISELKKFIKLFEMKILLLIGNY